MCTKKISLKHLDINNHIVSIQKLWDPKENTFQVDWKNIKITF